MKTLTLSRGAVAIVDDEDYEWLSQWKWSLQAKGYAWRNVSDGKGKRKYIIMHRLIMGNPDGLEIDHINGDSLDNRRENLRIVTHQQNCFNMKGHRGTSSFKGVAFDKPNNKWKAGIMINGKHKNLGRFVNEQDAANAYLKASTFYFGEFANTRK